MAELLGNIAETVGEAANIAAETGYPVRITPAFGLGSERLARNIFELREASREMLRLSPTGEIAVEKVRHG